MKEVMAWHNVSRDRDRYVDGYQRGDVLVPVASWLVADDRDDLDAAEDAFRLLNTGDDPAFGEPDPVAVEYRTRGNRSVSVADVVRIGGRGGRWYAVASAGFTELDHKPAGFSYRPARGSVPVVLAPEEGVPDVRA